MSQNPGWIIIGLAGHHHRRGHRGLTTAIALGKAGIEAEVYEHASALREAAAGIALMANSLDRDRRASR